MVIDKMIISFNELMNHIDNVIAEQCLNSIALKPKIEIVKKEKIVKFKGVRML